MSTQPSAIPEIRVRPAIPADAAALHEIHTDSVRGQCADAYPPATIRAWLTGRTPEGYLPGIERGEMFVAVRDGHPVGFGHATPGEVQAVFVRTDAARSGIGARLLAHGLERASVADGGCVTLAATMNAEPFYLRCGFEVTGHHVIERAGEPIPVVEMSCRLDPRPWRVIEARAGEYPDPLRVARGDVARMTRRDSEWPGWIWCEPPSGPAGWAPAAWIEIDGDRGRFTRDYAATELDLEAAQVIDVEHVVSGWAWGTHPDGITGWAPLRHLLPVA